MHNKKAQLAKRLSAGLDTYKSKRSLPGLLTDARQDALVLQLVDSVRRVAFVGRIDSRPIATQRGDPNSDMFDPVRAALLRRRAGDIDEAAWLIFLSVHCGRHARQGWRLAKDLYGRLSEGTKWSWTEVDKEPKAFRKWLSSRQQRFQGYRFGNHRKYQSIDAMASSGTGAAVESYVRWVQSKGSHRELFNAANHAVGTNSKAAFDQLYRSMGAVASFGRTARFDYLTMIGKARIADIQPGSAYLAGATGPVRGGRLLFGGSIDANIAIGPLDTLMVEMGDALDVGMQEIEDSLCNWQKSPGRFIRFRG